MAEGMFYNVAGGYVEGIVRGYRNTLLTGQNYANLTQCETIDGTLFPLQLQCITSESEILTVFINRCETTTWPSIWRLPRSPSTQP